MTQTTLLGPMIMEVDPSKMDEAADEAVNTLQVRRHGVWVKNVCGSSWCTWCLCLPFAFAKCCCHIVGHDQLWLVAQTLFSGLVTHKSGVPSEVRLILRHVQSEVQGKFSDQAAHKAMGGFLFLRLLCPSLMAPQVYGLLKGLFLPDIKFI